VRGPVRRGGPVTPPTGQSRAPQPLREGSVPPNTCFETSQGQVLSRLVASTDSSSQFCLILHLHVVAVPIPPTFAMPRWNSFVQFHVEHLCSRQNLGPPLSKRPLHVQ